MGQPRKDSGTGRGSLTCILFGEIDHIVDMMSVLNQGSRLPRNLLY